MFDNREAKLYPVTLTHGRWITRKLRPLHPGQSLHAHSDELAVREDNIWTIRQNPDWLKRRIKNSLGFKTIG